MIRFLIAFILLLNTTFCFAAANTSTEFPRNIGVCLLCWDDSTNLFYDDDAYAFSNSTGEWVTPYDFNFNIPYQAEKISGIKVEVEARINPECSVSKPGAQSVAISGNSGTTFSPAKTFVTSSGSFAVFTLGDSGDLWGYSLPLSPDTMNNAKLQVKITSNLAGTWGCGLGYGPEIHVDYVTATVYYIMPGNHKPFSQERTAR